jgi:tetrahydromethanopterin S-methyltransferase subunit B
VWNRNGAEVVTNMRSLITKQDQAIQNKLKALTEYKDSLTNTMTSYGTHSNFPHRDSMNKS